MVGTDVTAALFKPYDFVDELLSFEVEGEELPNRSLNVCFPGTYKNDNPASIEVRLKIL